MQQNTIGWKAVPLKVGCHALYNNNALVYKNGIQQEYLHLPKGLGQIRKSILRILGEYRNNHNISELQLSAMPNVLATM
jgi:hypothetical protein